MIVNRSAWVPVCLWGKTDLQKKKNFSGKLAYQNWNVFVLTGNLFVQIWQGWQWQHFCIATYPCPLHQIYSGLRHHFLFQWKKCFKVRPTAINQIIHEFLEPKGETTRLHVIKRWSARKFHLCVQARCADVSTTQKEKRLSSEDWARR